jgi:phosphoadenosine phosphosulfate reductase
MYAYTYDEQSGGLLLTSSPLAFSKEPRPVYYKELDILGFNKYWNYEKNDAYPYMWAEANSYYYRGRKVAQTKGGSCYTAPEIVILEDPEPNGELLRFVDIPAMVEKNRRILDGLVQDTIKEVYNTYLKYKEKVDVFYVAFSGGKDSIVTLDIVQRALPHNAFKVLFGDTGMEFPDTYATVDKIEKYCINNNIDFVRAKSEYSPEYTWSRFGPPATVTRWCCNVHKTVPQVLALRKRTGKPDFTGMAFIGIRASESISRSEYDYISLGEKHKGQYSCNPILEWNSAELYTYIFMGNLLLNEAYKKGNKRVGCLVCPRAAERNDFMSRTWYMNDFDKFINVIKKLYKKNFLSKDALNEFIENGGWKARKNGRDISIEIGYSESTARDKQILNVVNPRTDWKEWIKTIGVLLNESSPYTILFHNTQHRFEVSETKQGYNVYIGEELAKADPLFVKLLKNVFRKAACCINCHECEADCHNGCISMKDGQLKISDDCIHCSQCHKVDKGCLVYKSLEMPKGGLIMSANKSLNCYSHHAPKMEWFTQYFNYRNEFDQKHSLGSQMYSFFRRFLRDSELLDENGFSNTAEVIDKIGLNNLSSWGIMLVNLSYTPQINWYVKRLNMFETYTKDYTLSLLVNDGAKESWVNDIWSSFGRFVELPFSEVGMGSSKKEKKHVVSIMRTPWQNPDPRVILYSLYKFAEGCGGYYQFTLSRLLNHTIDSDGVSPTEIFGIDRDRMEKLLTGLSVNYPEFINASFTLDLDNITLRSEKTSQDVVTLF